MELNVNVLLGKTIVEIEGCDEDSESIIFTCNDNSEYEMYHEQDCCEYVRVYDINGDVDDLLNSPITQAEEVTNSEDEMELNDPDSFTWTFYKFATIKGYVTIRWLGESNGYYSERVSFKQIQEPEDDDSEFEEGFLDEEYFFEPDRRKTFRIGDIVICNKGAGMRLNGKIGKVIKSDRTTNYDPYEVTVEFRAEDLPYNYVELSYYASYKRLNLKPGRRSGWEKDNYDYDENFVHITLSSRVLDLYEMDDDEEFEKDFEGNVYKSAGILLHPFNQGGKHKRLERLLLDKIKIGIKEYTEDDYFLNITFNDNTEAKLWNENKPYAWLTTGEINGNWFDGIKFSKFTKIKLLYALKNAGKEDDEEFEKDFEKFCIKFKK